MHTRSPNNGVSSYLGKRINQGKCINPPWEKQILELQTVGSKLLIRKQHGLVIFKHKNMIFAEFPLKF